MKAGRGTRIALAVAAGLVAVATVALAVLLNLDWNRAKPWLNARTGDALGRPFAIAGDLTLTWENPAAAEPGWGGIIPWPHLVARDVRIGNPPSLNTPAEMANIRRMDFSVDPLALLDKRITIPLLRFDSPMINLRRGADGKDNWTFTNDASAWRLELQRVAFSKGSVHLIDAVKHADLSAEIDTIDADPRYGMTWRVHGKFNGEAVNGNGKAGAVLALRHQSAPYPILANVRVGPTAIALEGSLTKPTDLAALDMRLKISGPSMGRLYAISGIFLPETPPFSTEGHLIGTLGRHGGHWVYEKFSGKVGSSDIGGSLDYLSKEPRPLLSGTVASHQMRLSDLAPLIGADSNASKAERGAVALQPQDKALPVEPFKTERWTSIDADIKFSADKVMREQELPINKLNTHVHLKDGVLSLLPLEFDLAGGNLSSNITLDGSKNAIKAQLKVSARHLKLKQLFPKLQALQGGAGELNGDASLSAVGNSVASLLGASNGEIKTLINQGTVSKLLLEEMGLNIGSVVLTRLFGDKQVRLNCMATDFGVTNGLMQTHSFIVDTDAAILDVSGTIDLAREQLDLTIKPDSKGLRVFSLRAPLYVRGSFKEPRVSVDKRVLSMKAGGALALAALAPLAALLPLINTGPGESSECARLLADARVKPVAPAPGKTYRERPATPN